MKKQALMNKSELAGQYINIPQATAWGLFLFFLSIFFCFPIPGLIVLISRRRLFFLSNKLTLQSDLGRRQSEKAQHVQDLDEGKYLMWL